MKQFIPKLSKELFKVKIQIESELSNGNKTNEKLYSLIQKTIDFLKQGRKGEPVSKKLLIYKYFESKYGVTNLFLIKITKEARAFYTSTAQDEFTILQIILEVHKTHKEYEQKGKYTKH
ncbi:hypothetical protein DRN69_01090 [Candidatus Pacearchaeota archaeon]|nr:MAG: hypothetical protein DRN69_01090 [Candidatus Pacearchaeota archaeon]